jgi:GNAT superfamily N-acetyltransferase
MAAAGRDEAELWAFTSALDELGVELLRRNGYSPKRQFWHMRIELEGRTFEPKTVPGVSVRPADLNLEAPNIHELMEAGFSEHWGFSPSTFDDWSVVMRRPDFDAGLWLIAEAEGRIVGGAIGSLGDVPFIRDLAVLKEWRGRGIGAALLEASFAEFARRGVPNVTLNVDAGNETGAVALYERVGMQPIRRFVGAVKELRD